MRSDQHGHLRRHHFPRPHWHGRRLFLLPFAFFFGGITLLFLIGIGSTIYVVLTQGRDPFNGNILVPLCGLPIAFVLVSSLVSSIAFRRFGRPMSDVFSAIDSISEGDLSVRVPENYPRQFGQLARRFNHMIKELERADQQRRNLTADIAHELRTPLHIIQGNLEGILDGVYQPTAEHINNTLDETNLLTRLVNDLQTLSLAEAGQLQLHPTRFLLADLMDDVITGFASQTSSLGIDLKRIVRDSFMEITADYDRLNQILSNLTANAIRHTQKGGSIVISAEASTSGIRLEVNDTGSGIPEEDLPFIFDRFWRGDKSRSGRANSGLGLAITKQLVQAHGGTIDVQSRDNEGTTFAIEIPQ
jgi:two-component system OmpR family sensor kinase/two-component system sensor histidine kinase BaeS